MQSNQANLATGGVAVAAISVDEVAAGRALSGKLGLAFPILSDVGGTTIKAFGVFDDQTEIAWPSIFVVAKDGTIVQRWLADTYKERIPTADVLRELETK